MFRRRGCHADGSVRSVGGDRLLDDGRQRCEPVPDDLGGVVPFCVPGNAEGN